MHRLAWHWWQGRSLPALPAIRVNALAPTITDTPLAERLLDSADKRRAAAPRHPLGRIGSADDLAAIACWLLTEAPLLTGQVVAADAGLAAVRNHPESLGSVPAGPWQISAARPRRASAYKLA